MQYFRMQEIVYVGARSAVDDFLAEAHRSAARLFAAFGLSVRSSTAADPFFGSGGRLLVREQLDRDLKQEYLAEISGQPVALASVNSHETHFTRPYGITGDGTGTAVSACVGFGLERIVLAALAVHGFDPGAWPDLLRRNLAL
jgi:hypothetical protein